MEPQPWRANSVTLRDCCAAHEPNISAITDDLGEYAGDLFYGTPTNVHEDMSNPNGLRQDGALHLYKHRYTYNNDRLDCDLCNHYISLSEDDGNAKLIARRTDNNNVVGIGTYDFSWDIDSWINSSVRFQHFRPADEEHGNTRDIWQSWKLVIDGISGEGNYPERGTIPFTVKIDKTAPKTTPTVTTGVYKTPISKLENEDGTYNSEAYGIMCVNRSKIILIRLLR